MEEETIVKLQITTKKAVTLVTNKKGLKFIKLSKKDFKSSEENPDEWTFLVLE